MRTNGHLINAGVFEPSHKVARKRETASDTVVAQSDSRPRFSLSFVFIIPLFHPPSHPLNPYPLFPCSHPLFKRVHVLTRGKFVNFPVTSGDRDIFPFVVGLRSSDAYCAPPPVTFESPCPSENACILPPSGWNAEKFQNHAQHTQYCARDDCVVDIKFDRTVFAFFLKLVGKLIAGLDVISSTLNYSVYSWIRVAARKSNCSSFYERIISLRNVHCNCVRRF